MVSIGFWHDLVSAQQCADLEVNGKTLFSKISSHWSPGTNLIRYFANQRYPAREFIIVCQGTPDRAVASVESKIRQAWSMHRRCRRLPTLRPSFAGFPFPPDVIVIAVRWYLRYALSHRDVEELLIERGITVDHMSVYRWVQRFTSLHIAVARPCRHTPGDRWFVDETVRQGLWAMSPSVSGD